VHNSKSENRETPFIEPTHAERISEITILRRYELRQNGRHVVPISLSSLNKRLKTNGKGGTRISRSERNNF